MIISGALDGDGASQRISLLAHAVLNGAMIWMLLAMPLLMAGDSVAGGMSGPHHGGDAAAMPTGTPVWADAVNVSFVILSASSAGWWLLALLRRGRHVHDACYAGMAAGMAVMLAIMNA